MKHGNKYKSDEAFEELETVITELSKAIRRSGFKNKYKQNTNNKQIRNRKGNIDRNRHKDDKPIRLFWDKT